MLALVGAGVLNKTTAFPVNDVTPELVKKSVILKENNFPLYGELLAPLANVGRYDLVSAVERKIAEYYQDQKRQKWRERAEPIVAFDRKYLNGSLKKVKNSIFDKNKVK